MQIILSMERSRESVHQLEKETPQGPEVLQIMEIAEIENTANAGTGEERMVESFAAKKRKNLKK